MLEAILFDLDGTLLPMDTDVFTRTYFKRLAQYAYAWGYTDSKLLMKGVMDGLEAMVRNDGRANNETVFWEVFSKVTSKDGKKDRALFEEFYRTGFHEAKSCCETPEISKKIVELAKTKAQKVILSTNPVFPTVADESRLSWIGLKMDDFALVTDFENCSYAKPNPEYFKTILKQFDLDPKNCLMIGNDALEDMWAASEAGLPVYLVTDCLVNKKDLPITCETGSLEDLYSYLETL